MQRNRLRFYAALTVLAAWAIGLGVMAYTSAEKPRPVEASPIPATPTPG